MTDREKLIEILRVPIYPHELADPAEVVADYLLDNGVTFATDNNVGDKWIPVTERLPKPYMDVITLRKNLFSEEYQSCGLEYITIKGIADIPTWSKDNVTWKTKVTHWMPLPEPPKGE